jgi:hypothetical protein
MTAKKSSTTKGRATKRRPTLEQRALAIIGAAEGYGADTRRAVELSLNDLRETVRRAEAGDTVLDLTDPAEADADAPDLAEMIAAVWNHPDCPEDIADALNAGTSDLFNRLNEGERNVYKTPIYIRALLWEYAIQKGGAK